VAFLTVNQITSVLMFHAESFMVHFMKLFLKNGVFWDVNAMWLL
jgi:hypothetical protein